MSASITLGSKDYCVVQCKDVGTLETARASATALFEMMYTIQVHYQEMTTLLCDYTEVPRMTYMVSERPDPRGHDTDNIETDSELVEYVDSDVSDE